MIKSCLSKDTEKEPRHLPPPSLFPSFWLGGFESSCHITREGDRVDMIAATQHDRFARRDYAMLRANGIHAVRDGVRWPLIDRSGKYDFSSFETMVDAAIQEDMLVVWNLCHYGWPEDVDLLKPQFIDRFAAFCKAVASFVRSKSDEIPFYTPINEISWLAFAAGHDGYLHPCRTDCADEVKRQLVRATIAGIHAIWDVDRRARIVLIDPLMHIVPPHDRPDLQADANVRNESVFHAWDMLGGVLAPELGGHPRYLDILGINYYHSNHRELPDSRLRWEDDPRDPRWVPLHRLMASFYQRYRRPFFISETSHFGMGRSRWIMEIADEVARARNIAVPVEGVCIYPILDRPDWDDLDFWHHSGLWDLRRNGDTTLHRVPNKRYFTAFRHAQDLLSKHGCR